ncbi:thiol:disulfide interchange protein [Qipengyuania marisflavi]|uniref:Thiol:disulfide interchange protein n=2 Tax=Qipengyuania marisflavi TaxID=2486356 RepID=A0A5S3PAI2_9SPHN|nr:thiol:disulfide interchange protein [Qipengyuania marisflavi]
MMLAAPAVHAQTARSTSDRIAVEVSADGPPVPGEVWTVALHFTPRSSQWHGYWSNPGDAGLGMELDWTLPQGWVVNEALYPVPKQLLIGGLMNHVYEGPYTVLVPVRVPADAAVANPPPIGLTARYLACTDKICVPQQARLTLDPANATAEPRMAEWRAAIVPPLGSAASFEFAGTRLRIGIPLPAASDLGDVHFFLGTSEVGQAQQAVYSGVQTFIREGDLLVVEYPLKDIVVPDTVELAFLPRPDRIEGILALGPDRGVRIVAAPGNVPLEGIKPFRGADSAPPPLMLLLLGALAGGLLLNIMPCVFPILSLKALSLAKAGGDERGARRDALAYTAGVVLACTALGALLLLLRSAGEQVGWAFQLQEPRVVVALLLLAVAITANFLGLFQVPGIAISGGKPSATSSFATGLLAAFVATPCTGPFMAVALGAALIIPPLDGLLVFAVLGLGLALPFLLIGFVPALRRLLPRPGPWMERFRRWMALPMGLTALALAWLLWRIGGVTFVVVVLALTVTMLGMLAQFGRAQRAGTGRSVVSGLAVLAVAAIALIAMPQPRPLAASAQDSLLAPEPFSEAALASARTSGRPVFVWFTADWCVTCKVNESVAIERETTRAAFAKADVKILRGDWTRRDPEIATFLARQGAAGVPLYVWYPPGGEARQLPQVLTPDLLAELAQSVAARGTAQ